MGRARRRGAHVEAVREAVGPEVDFGLDFHGRVTKPMAKRLAVALVQEQVVHREADDHVLDCLEDASVLDFDDGGLAEW